MANRGKIGGIWILAASLALALSPAGGSSPQVYSEETWLAGEIAYLVNMASAMERDLGMRIRSCKDWMTAPTYFRDPVAPNSQTALACKDRLDGDGYRIGGTDAEGLVEVRWKSFHLSRKYTRKASSDSSPIAPSDNKFPAVYCASVARNLDALIQSYSLLTNRMPRSVSDLRSLFGDPFARNPKVPGKETRIKEVFSEAPPGQENRASKYYIQWDSLQLFCPQPADGDTVGTFEPLALARLHYHRLVKSGAEPAPESALTRSMIGLP